MRKGITPVVAIVLLISMTIFAAAMSYFWINSVQSSLMERAGSSTENAPGTDCTRLNIISVRGDKAVIKNVGCSNVTEFNMLINGRLTKYTLDEPLAPGESTIVTYSPQQAGEDLTVEVVGSWGTSTVTSPADENTEEAGFTSGTTSSSQPTNPLHINSVSVVEFSDHLEGYCNAYSDNENDLLRYNFSWTINNIEAFSNIEFKEGSISGGTFHSCGILTNGSAVCWGDNVYGELGDGTATSSSVPVFVSGGYNFSQVSLKGYDSCGVLTNMSAVCWGYNAYGQLGDGTTTSSYVPVFVSGGYNFSQVSIGVFHSCGILENGSALCWGDNTYGQLGDGTTTSSSVPVFVSGNYLFRSLDAGKYFTCGVLTNGSALCWGNNTYGQLGNGTAGGYSTTPQFIESNKVSKVYVGLYHVCVVLSNNSALCWGNNTYGQLGNGTAGGLSALPQYVSGNYNFTIVSGGTYHSCGILTNGSAVCWGSNSDGQLGDGTVTSRTSPVYVVGPYNVYDNLNYSSIDLGNSHTCAIATNGSALCWGYNFQGQVGDGTVTSRNSPVYVEGGLSFINNSYYWNDDTLVSVLPSQYYNVGDSVTFYCSVLDSEYESDTYNSSLTI